MTYSSIEACARSVDLEAALADHAPPALELVVERAREVGGRAAEGVGALALEALLHLRARGRVVDRLVERAHHVGGQARGPDDAPPRLDVEALHARLLHRRY